MRIATANLSIDTALSVARERYAAGRPKSRASFDRASGAMPGGNTRSVLFFEPFPLTLDRGDGVDVWDIDGNRYTNFVGEFSAGLYGHSDPVIKRAIVEALDSGIALSAPTVYEERLASAIRDRFPSLDLLRFCNSGTEANILALVTAMAFTRRRKILVFREAYHGGVLVFAGGGTPINLPFDFVLGDYNDVEGTAALIRQHADDLAAVIVEPILGAGGNIPGDRDFLRTLRDETERCGAVLIFDEIKTSRCGAGGMQAIHAIRPDLTTLGKYIGGGLPTGVFGGRREIMALYDPAAGQGLRHAGTFNNNVCSMAAGLAGLTKVFTASRADAFLEEGEALREELNERMVASNVPMQFVGLGSIFTVHFSCRPVKRPQDIPPVSKRLAQLFHIECLLNGVLLASRGDVFMSLPIQRAHKAALCDATARFIDVYGDLARREVAAVD